MTQAEITVCERGLSRARVDSKPSDHDGDLSGVLSRSTQHGAKARLELGSGEGLHDVVVGSRVEGANDLRLVVSGRDDDDWDFAHGPEHPEQINAVDVRQSQVQEHDVRMLVDDQRQSSETRRRGPHVVAPLRERPLQPGPDLGIVLDDQDGCHAASTVRGLSSTRAD